MAYESCIHYSADAVLCAYTVCVGVFVGGCERACKCARVHKGRRVDSRRMMVPMTLQLGSHGLLSYEEITPAHPVQVLTRMPYTNCAQTYIHALGIYRHRNKTLKVHINTQDMRWNTLVSIYLI